MTRHREASDGRLRGGAAGWPRPDPIDPATGTVYVVAYLAPGRFEMVALALQDGGIRWRQPIELPNANPLYQLNRPAVALAGGRAYASFGSRLDCSLYHGYVASTRLDGGGLDAVFQVSPNRGGAIWAPGGPVVLPDGDLLVSTANSPIVAGGVVWDIDFERGYLLGLDPGSGAVRQRVAVGTAEHFVSPSASDGRLFVPAGRGLLAFSFG